MNCIYHSITTPLGVLIVVADEQYLYGLYFEDCFDHKRYTYKGITEPIQQVQSQLEEYFLGTRNIFMVPLFLQGTEFQQRTRQALQQVPYGKTIAYKELASSLGKPTAYRAAANANGANPLVIIIPCHSVINANGSLGGYSAGIERKKWLLEHELKNIKY